MEGLVDYRDLTKFDHIVYKALALSLPAELRSVVCERMDTDYFSDVGIIGLLRSQHLMTGSVEQTASLYWSTRREEFSPRIETLLTSILMNLASSVIYDLLLKDLITHVDVSRLLDYRNLSIGNIANLGESATVYWGHAKALLQLYRIRKKDEFAAVDVVRNLLVKQEKLPSVGEAEDEIIIKNLRSIIRGLLVQELERIGEKVVLPVDGFRVEGLHGSPGMGWGYIAHYQEGVRPPDSAVLVAPANMRFEHREAEMLRQAAAILAYGGGTTSHTPIFCRAAAIPCLVVTMDDLFAIKKFSYAVVDVTENAVRLYAGEPPDLPKVPARSRVMTGG